jgi:hypothetical protein
VKRCLVDEKGEITINGVAMSQLAVKSVIDMMDTENHDPGSWRRWIDGQFVP